MVYNRLKKTMKRFLLIGLLLTGTVLHAQLKPIGTWTDHLPYRNATSITKIDKTVVCGTESGIFIYNTEDFSIETYSKVNSLNDVVVSKIDYSNKYKTLIVAYNTGNIDLIINGNVSNLPFVKLSNRSGNPNDIYIKGNFAYISYNFGIVVIDIVKKEIKDTYQFGAGGASIVVNSTVIINNTIFAGTNQGYYSANLNTNLLDFNNWSKSSLFLNKQIIKTLILNNKLAIVVREAGIDSTLIIDSGASTTIPELSGLTYTGFNKRDDGGYNFTSSNLFMHVDSLGNVVKSVNHTISSTLGSAVIDNSIYITGTTWPLSEIDMLSEEVINVFKPNGPSDKIIFDMALEGGNLWTVNGAHNVSYGNNFFGPVFQHLYKGKWTVYQRNTYPDLDNSFDLISVTINPNNPNNVFFSSWGRGVIQLLADNTFRQYLEDNSSLQRRKAWEPAQWVGAGESAFDEQGNLWVTNPYTRNGLSVRKTNGEWKTFDLSDLIIGEETVSYDIVISNEGYKWISLPRDNTIIVYDDRGTIDNTSDDRAILLTSGEGQGDVPGNRGIKMEKDRNGLIWIGTSDGIAVHFNPSNVFEERNRDFSRIIFFDGENNEIVLQGATVLDIAIDGANRKWIGTDNSGVLLLSPDGKETIQEFNENNSPLLSNTVTAISIDDETGEVFFATTEGLVSYRSDVVKGSENLSEIKIAPNPVRSTFTGPINISGLKENTTVKITDINGKLVMELKSQGGSVNWDGNNLNGERAATGVYLVLVSAAIPNNRVETAVGKIMFIK